MQKLDMKNPFDNADIYYREVTDSTMNDARALLETSPPTGTLVYASMQTRGRGRVEGRKWLAFPGESLLFTMLVKSAELSFPVSMFPLFAGYSIAGVLEKDYAVSADVKWPNDVLVNSRKISGILCENSGDYILCGIGFNLRQEGFTSEIEEGRAVSLRQLTGKDYEPEVFLDLLLGFMKNSLYSSVKWLTELEKILYKRGENVVLCEGLPESGKRLEGVITGIGKNGELVIKDAATGNFRQVYSGEILCS